MNNSAKLTGRKLDRFLSDLSELIDAFPSRETKSQLDRELGVLIGFLEEFRERLKSLPTEEDMDGVTSAIEMIKDQLRIAESDPMLSRVIGILPDNGALRKSQHKPMTKQAHEEARTTAEEMKGMALGDLEHKLKDKKKYNNAMLRQIGNELGLRFPSKSTRLSMIDRIIKHISNFQGYRYLRHGDDRPLTEIMVNE